MNTQKTTGFQIIGKEHKVSLSKLGKTNRLNALQELLVLKALRNTAISNTNGEDDSIRKSVKNTTTSENTEEGCYFSIRGRVGLPLLLKALHRNHQMPKHSKKAQD